MTVIREAALVVELIEKEGPALLVLDIGLKNIDNFNILQAILDTYYDNI